MDETLKYQQKSYIYLQANNIGLAHIVQYLEQKAILFSDLEIMTPASTTTNPTLF